MTEGSAMAEQSDGHASMQWPPSLMQQRSSTQARWKH